MTANACDGVYVQYTANMYWQNIEQVCFALDNLYCLLIPYGNIKCDRLIKNDMAKFNGGIRRNNRK